jgi:hypothetical protein
MPRENPSSKGRKPETILDLFKIFHPSTQDAALLCDQRLQKLQKIAVCSPEKRRDSLSSWSILARIDSLRFVVRSTLGSWRFRSSPFSREYPGLRGQGNWAPNPTHDQFSVRKHWHKTRISSPLLVPASRPPSLRRLLFRSCFCHCKDYCSLQEQEGRGFLRILRSSGYVESMILL